MPGFQKKQTVLTVITAVLVIGSIWGLTEMTLGGFLHAIHFPNKGAVMGGLAISYMALFVRITGRPVLVPLLGLIAASFKPGVTLFLGVPVWSPFVINPAIAIVLQALVFGVVATAMKGTMEKYPVSRVFAGITAGYLGYASYAVAASMLGLGRWPFLDLSAKLGLVLTEGTPIAVAGAILLVAGYKLGKAVESRFTGFSRLHPRLFYSSSLALVLLAWVISFAADGVIG